MFLTCNPKRDKESQVGAQLNSNHGNRLSQHVPPSPPELRWCALAHVPVHEGVGPVHGFEEVSHFGRPSRLLELLAELRLQEEIYQGLDADEDQEEGKGSSKSDLCVEFVGGWDRDRI